MISVLVLMAMLATLTPFQALAADTSTEAAPAQATVVEAAQEVEPEAAATDTAASSEAVAKTAAEEASASGAAEEKAEAAAADAVDEVATEGNTEAAPVEEPDAADTETVAAEIEPEEETVAQEEKAAGGDLLEAADSYLFIVSDGSGNALDKDENGGYTVNPDKNPYEVTLQIEANVTSSGTINAEGMLVIEDTLTEVSILKVDAKTGKGLAGAKLQVLDDNGVVCEEWTSTTEAHVVRGLYTGVTYTLREVTAPKGYDKAKDITFSMDAYGKLSSKALKDGKIVMEDTLTPSKSSTNKTGDSANGALWAMVLVLAGGALAGTVWFRRRRKI